MLVGVLADTHIPHRLKNVPIEVGKAFRGVDLILHAGDLVAPWVLDELKTIAPVKAVRGNVHLVERTIDHPHLPLVEEMELEGLHLVLTHGHVSLLHGSLERARYWVHRNRTKVNERIIQWCTRAYPAADAIVFGHSHQPYNRRIERTLLFNPGAVCYTRGEAPSVGLLRIHKKEVEAEIVYLDNLQ